MKTASSIRDSFGGTPVVLWSTVLLLAFPLLHGAETKTGPAPGTKWFPGHYMEFGHTAPLSHWQVISNRPDFQGGKRIYRWCDLEPEEGRYDFTSVTNDLRVLRALGKRTAIEVWDTWFHDDGKRAVPTYLLENPRYAGGWVRDARNNSAAKRWIPAVADRYLALVDALGGAFDAEPDVAAYVHTETALGPWLLSNCADFSAEAYDIQLRRVILRSRSAFPRTPVILYGNWHTEPKTKEDLALLGEFAATNGVGWGCPDLLPEDKIWGYDVIRKLAGRVPLGAAAQWSSFENRDRLPVSRIMDFAVHDLKLHFIFWLKADRAKTGGLSFTNDVLPGVAARHGESVRARPVLLGF